MSELLDGFFNYFSTTGFHLVTWKMAVMWIVVGVLLYLGIAKRFEPLLLVPIAFGALIANLPSKDSMLTREIGPDGFHETALLRIEGTLENYTLPATETLADGTVMQTAPATGVVKVRKVRGGLYDFVSQGIKLEIFPPLIFLGVGALADFGPLIAMPRMILIAAAAQAGLFLTFMGAGIAGFLPREAASIAIIGSSDGPTTIFVANKLAPHLLGAVAVAAYTYMALVPLIQPPVMRLMTTYKERRIRMRTMRRVSKLEKLIFGIAVTMICVMIAPDTTPLLAMLMFGNFLRECGVTERLVKAAQNEIIDAVTILLGTSVGITMAGDTFLEPRTLMIIFFGVFAFGISTAFGVGFAKILSFISPRNPLNPLIGSAAVSAMPMSARVSQNVAQQYDKNNYLLMHAMGPNVAGVIASTVVAGYFISTLSGL